MPPRPADEVLAELEKLGVRLGLAPFRALLQALGRPERATATILVAGTNGKGSTAALLASMARAAGRRVGLYTSPHLERPEERIQIAGRAVESDRLAEALDRVLSTTRRAGLVLPTYFEAVTAAAFVVFADAGLDLAVLEVGMGGRLDATNASDPALSVITPIALDHTAELGPTLAAVAGEKAGILRPGRPALTSVQDPDVLAVLERVASRVGAKLRRAEALARIDSVKSSGLAGHELTVSLGDAALDLRLPLAGGHQIENLRTALAAARLMPEAGLGELPVETIRDGVAATRWPGRLETVALPPGRIQVLLDAAHNAHGSAALARFLDALDEPFTLLFGALADKRVDQMLPALAARAAAVVLTRAPSPRAEDPDRLRALVGAGRADRSVAVEPGFEAALEVALGSGTGRIVACGSIYLVGAVRAELRRRFGVPRPA